MKPLNLDNSPCSPTSSNCVIWQGPDLACIKLCKGDTVSDVVAKLAAELCTILDQLNVNNYDLTCFNSSACPPVDFQALIQFLIDHICALEGVTPNTNPSTSTCPDCVVSIAPCFIIGTQTTMQLVDYVQMIGERVCDLINTIDGLQIQIDNIDNRVYVLENAPKETFTLPSITVACTLSPTVLGGSAYPIDTILNALVNDPTNGYCSLIDATGLGADLFSAVSSQCITSTTPTLSNPPVPFGTEYLGTWVATPTTVADAITNLWIVVCDMYDFLSNLDNTITVEDTNTVSLTLSPSNVLTALLQDTDWHNLEGFDFYTADPRLLTKRPMVRRIGNVIHFRGTVTIPLDSFTSPGTVVEYDYRSGVNTYEGLASITSPAHSNLPYSGIGGINFLSGGSIQFNKGVSVIPTTVLPAGYVIDSVYSLGWRMGWRNMYTGTCNNLLTTMCNSALSPGGQLTWGVLVDLEESFVSGCNPGAWSTSAMNYVISNVTAGNHVTDFKSAVNVHDSTSTGNQNAQPDFKTAETYPITINANDPQQIGGFQTIIDGLTAFISPCGALIPTPTPCVPS
jgi:hypothetical protein